MNNKKENNGKKRSLQCPFLHIEQVFDKYDTSLKGLTQEESEKKAGRMRKEYTTGKRESNYMESFNQPVKKPSYIYINCSRDPFNCYK